MEVGKYKQGLLKFKNIIGYKKGQIVPNTKIKKAILTLTSEGRKMGKNSIEMYQMYKDWEEDTTWDDLNNGIQLGSEASVISVLNIDALTKGTRSYDVTETVQNWVNGSNNYGWVFIAKNNGFWNFRSSKWKGLVERPMLTIIYETQN